MRFPVASSSCALQNWLWRIKESSSNGKWQQVFAHYRDMTKTGLQLTEPSLFPPILKACLTLSLKHGESVHACLFKQGLDSFSSIGNSIIDFYIKSADFDSALALFSYLKSRDSISWNIMIYGQLDRGALEEGLCLFKQGRVAGFEPNTATLVLVIQSFRSLKATREGLLMHGYLIQSGFWAIASIQNSLLNMYTEIQMEAAQKLFDDMCGGDLISWSVMIKGYVQSEEAEVAFQLFRNMVSTNELELDGQVMVTIIKACIHLGKLRIGRMVHAFVNCRGFNYDTFVGNSLVDMYSKCHDTESSSKAFREISQKNIVSWNSLLSGFVSNEKYSQALILFDSMQKAGIEADEVTFVNLLQPCKQLFDPIHCKSIHSKVVRQGYEKNELVMNSLVDAYAKCNLIAQAWNLFNCMKRRDTATWSTMIAGFTHSGMPDEAIAIFHLMNQVGNKPNSVTMLNLLEACSVSAELKRSKTAHGIAIRRCLAEEVPVGTAIVDMYSKSGAIDSSERVFDKICEKNIISYGAMIAAYGMHGFPHNALALCGKMKAQGLKPNPIITLSVLSACSHGGLIKEGLSFFKELIEDIDVELGLEHYSCVVDLLGRAGKLDSAMELMKKMHQEGLKPGASAWGSLLSACRSYGDPERGAGAFSCVVELEPSNPAGYLLASNMYAMGGLWAESAKMRRLGKEKGARNGAGYSLVHANDKACKFVAGDDQGHPFSDEICLLSEQLHSCMKMEWRHDEADLVSAL